MFVLIFNAYTNVKKIQACFPYPNKHNLFLMQEHDFTTRKQDNKVNLHASCLLKYKNELFFPFSLVLKLWVQHNTLEKTRWYIYLNFVRHFSPFLVIIIDGFIQRDMKDNFQHRLLVCLLRSILVHSDRNLWHCCHPWSHFFYFQGHTVHLNNINLLKTKSYQKSEL